MNIISYSQCGEDVFLLEKYFKHKKGGQFIELGALDGILYSNSKMFEDFFQWEGVLIEPHPYKFEQLQRNRPHCHLFNALVSNQTEELLFKYFLDGHAAVSGVKETLPKVLLELFHENPECEHLLKGEMYMKPKSLTDIIKDTPFKHFDLLSLDVEGHELEVLQSWNFSIPIDVILIESLGVIEKDEQCAEILLKNGYIFDTDYKHNKIFVHESFRKSILKI